MFTKLGLVKTAFIALTLALASCGGGGGEAGGPTFELFPSSVTQTANKGDAKCARTVGYTTTVSIIGGTPPYRVITSDPNNLSVSRTTVPGGDRTFNVGTASKGCRVATVLVLDSVSRSVTFTQTIEADETN